MPGYKKERFVIVWAQGFVGFGHGWLVLLLLDLWCKKNASAHG